MKKLIILFMFALFIVCVFKKDVKALTGSGTSSSPYVVTKGSELEEALSKGTSSWKYISVRDLTAITETINVEKGKFRIYAGAGPVTIRRSRSMTAKVNSSSKPLRCIKLDGTTEIEVGHTTGTQKLTLDGSKDAFTDSRQCNEFFYVGEKAKLTICANCIFTNAKSTMKTDEGAPIRNYGVTNVYGEISNCNGNNGGAIKSIGGYVNIFNGAKIHGCKSGTEGGAVYGKTFAVIIMNGGNVYSNQSAEEGGGFFSTEGNLVIYGGSVFKNIAGKTGGGVFAGNDSYLTIGNSGGSGPTISGNYAKNSGGGVRCNGGTDESGGRTNFYGGTITDNSTDVSGGGISVGKPSNGLKSTVDFENLTITNNSAGNYGGGICFSEDVKGRTTDEVPIKNCTIMNNKATTGGGGIHINTDVKITGTTISHNDSDEGGGIKIAGTGKLKFPSGTIESNTANKGEGVYQGGLFELSGSGYAKANNTVYLPSGRHIDVTNKLTVSSVLVSCIDSEVKTKGTILVDVTYSGGTAESELYYEGTSEDEEEGKSVQKRFITTDGRLIRASSKITSINSSRYIVISEKYDLKYNGNSLDPVANLPNDEIAFWNEKHKISNNIVSRIGFVLNVNKHWNLSADGNGTIVKPGTDTLINSNTTLYAIWEEESISSLSMTTRDRYYVVGQKIILTSKELTKKVVVENNLNLPITYEIKVTKIVSASGKTVAQGEKLRTEYFIDTEVGARYKLYLSASNVSGTVTCTGEMNVNILDDYYEKTEVRFISKEFAETLNPKSKWNREKEKELTNSLNNEDNYLYTIEISSKNMEENRNNIKRYGHKIPHGLNYLVAMRVIKQ